MQIKKNPGGLRTAELRLTELIKSEKTRKAAIIVVYTGMIFCLIPLLLPVQKLLFSNIDAERAALLSIFFAAFIVLGFILCCLYARNISLYLEGVDKTKCFTAVVSGFLVLYLVSIAIYSYFFGWRWLDSDHASEMILGKLLAEENTLLSRSWLYSTELRLVYQTIFTMPLFKIFGHLENWALIRSLNIFFNNAILILSYLFLMKQLEVKTKWVLFTAFFLVIPLSYGYWDIVIFGGYYIFFIAQLFCSLGLYIRLNSRSASGKKIMLEFILFSILAFILGVQGIRSLMVIYIPLLLVSVYNRVKITKEKFFPLIMGCYAFFLCSIGYIFNLLLQKRYSFYPYETMNMEHPALYLEKLGLSFTNIAGFFGLSGGSTILSAQGFFSVAALILCLVLIRTIYKTINCSQPEGEKKIIPLFFMASAIFSIFIFIITDKIIESRYFIPFMILYVPLTSILFEYAEKTFGYLKRTVIICGIILFIFGQGYINFQNLTVRDMNTGRKGHIEYLLDEELHFGFATFWNGNVITELSNGKIEMVGLERARARDGNRSFDIFGYLVKAKFLDSLHHTGESFMLLTRDEWDSVRSRFPFTGRIPDYDDKHFVIIRFPSAEIIYRDILGM